MIFMHKESGDLFELMMKTAQDYTELYGEDGVPALRIGQTILVGGGEYGLDNFAEDFEFIGFI